MVEGIDQAQSLIEELLRLRVVGGDRMMQVSQSRHQSGRLRFRLRMRRMILSEDAAASREGEQNGKPEFHEDVLLGSEAICER